MGRQVSVLSGERTTCALDDLLIFVRVMKRIRTVTLIKVNGRGKLASQPPNSKRLQSLQHNIYKLVEKIAESILTTCAGALNKATLPLQALQSLLRLWTARMRCVVCAAACPIEAS